ncbi:MAG: thioredoxin domain-containing protein, partial [Propionibacteriaceae bacterium]|nr:thioredoxin domain-containing protein [Propionibacteriaceae bacterium]
MSPANMNDKFDLSKLAPAASPTVSYVRDVDEAAFEAVASQSLQYPVVLELTLNNQPGTKDVDDALIELTNQGEGRWLLGRVDVATNPRIAQALGVQAVPTVLAIIGGQVAPLFQGTRDKADIKAMLDAVTRTAIANGVTGRAQPVP